MSAIIRLLVVGRPNVGKSTFINRIIRSKRAIVSDEPGVTRDVVYYPAQWDSMSFEIGDSGGIGRVSERSEALQDQVERAAYHAMEIANRILFLVDVRTGITDEDLHMLKLLRTFTDKVVLAVNKVDHSDYEADVSAFYRLGMGEPFPISASHGTGVSELMDAVLQPLAEALSQLPEDKTDRIAIVGQPNAGKSSLLNAILRDNRVLVSAEAGTTRDSVDASFEYAGHRYMFTDTAGIQKSAKHSDGVDYYMYLRASRTIEHCNVAIMVLSIDRFLTAQDKRIIQQILTVPKPMILFVNKWDLTSRTDQERRDLETMACNAFPGLANYPIIFGSAAEGVHIPQLLRTIPEVIEASRHRLSTPELNRIIRDIVSQNPPPAKGGKSVKVYYATQVKTDPPLFVFFVNDAELVGPTYQRFLENRMRKYIYPFKGAPIKLEFRSSHRKHS